ncbi:von Willebrand factor C domain-containing protein 2-like isoform X2 [Haliotis rubra]|uniref:von Willebrand factor C domain-containing protein 2-like isoform X2 n=1 Tax=Haliotis rubra TaxID=36100 RepID=UPI001EE53F9C|nr:von Willebrand factor C domain-containing protein 2-like isoform X2 [Haliotis rubra]
MIGILLLCLVSSALAAVINTTPVTLTTTPTTCERHGKYYKLGEHFKPTPCERCFCGASGRAACVYVDCVLALCVDAVKQPDQCCSTCPNGLNCKHGDVIIKMGELYHPDKATACQCNFGSPYLGFGSLELKANCTSI